MRGVTSVWSASRSSETSKLRHPPLTVSCVLGGQAEPLAWRIPTHDRPLKLLAPLALVAGFTASTAALVTIDAASSQLHAQPGGGNGNGPGGDGGPGGGNGNGNGNGNGPGSDGPGNSVSAAASDNGNGFGGPGNAGSPPSHSGGVRGEEMSNRSQEGLTGRERAAEAISSAPTNANASSGIERALQSLFKGSN